MLFFIVLPLLLLVSAAVRCSTNDILHDLLIGPTYNVSFSQYLQTKVNSSFLEESMKFLSSEVHQAGSERNNYLADYLANAWRAWGWPEVRVHSFNASLSVPVNVSVVELVNKTSGKIIQRFNTTDVNNKGEVFPIYQSYSKAGTVQNASFMYIHYARQEDLTKLSSLGVSICDSPADGRPLILIARLGFGERTGKISAVRKYCNSVSKSSTAIAGMLLYPDPQDFALDGTDSSKVYPNTWWLPGDAPVWGNVRFGGSGGGSWETPGIPSFDGTYPTHQASEVETPFPVQPISYNDAQILFNSMDSGPLVPADWLPGLARRVGPSSQLSLHLSVHTKMNRSELRNVIGVIPGSSPLLAPQTVLLGNHRDAWLYGASDPLSGSVIVHQIAQIIGQAYQKGEYRPRRSIIIASWDGEEPSLLGSGEFVSQWHRELLQSSVAYLNLDSPIKGSYSMSVRSDSLLQDCVVNASKSVQLNATTTLYDDWTSKIPLIPGNKQAGPKVSSLGGGSDHISFSYKFGIPCIYPEYEYQIQNIPNMPSYHTRYDNADYMLRLIDPGMKNTAILTRYVLDLLLRITDSEFIQYSPIKVLNDISQAIVSIEKSKQLEQFNVTFDAVKSELKLCNESLSLFTNQINQLIKQNSTQEKYQKLDRVNRLLLTIPRTFLTPDGIPGRSYFHNIIYSTGITNAYSGSVLAGIQSALLQNQRSIVIDQMNKLLDCIHSMRVLFQQGGLLGSPFN